MELSYVGGTSGGGTGASYTVSLNGTLTGGSNSSPSAGDLILVFTGEANGASVTSTCSGNTFGAYSTIRAHQNQADTHDANLDSFVARAGSTPDTTLTITRGNNNTTYGSSTVVHVWRSAKTVTGVTPTVAAAANGSAANPAAITPTVAGSVVLYCGHASQLAASGTAYTTAGTYPISRKTDGSTGDSIVMASHYTAWTSGAYDPAAFTGSTTATTLAWVALTIVIEPSVSHETTSVIVGPDSAVVGASKLNIPHATTGALVGTNVSIAGSAQRFREFNTAGVLTGPSATVAGSAARSVGGVSHAVTGALVGTSVTQRTNYILNNTFTGIDENSPTNTDLTGGVNVESGGNGLTSDILGVGTHADTGSNYIDVRLFGTMTGYFNQWFTPSNLSSLDGNIIGKTYTLSFRYSRTNTPATTSYIRAFFGIQNSEGSTLQSTDVDISEGDARYSLTITANAAGAHKIWIYIAHAINQATVDFTYRISELQLEESPVSTGLIPTSGTVFSAGHAAIYGRASRFRAHSTTGALAGVETTVAGAADTLSGATTHATTGVLDGPGAQAAGTALRFHAFATTGAIVGSGSEVSGLASRTLQHDATGVLVGLDTVLAGIARHNIPHATSGSLFGPESFVSGAASRNATIVTHASTGVLVADSGAASGSASRFLAHDTAGAPSGSGAAVSGASNRFRTFSASGILVGAESSLAGSSARTREHAATSVLVGDPSNLSASAQRNASHATDGVLATDGAYVAGLAARAGAAVTHSTSGAIVASFASVAGLAGNSVLLTPRQVEMLTDIWQRFGLDPAAPLTETETSASFAGIVLAKSGTNAITSTRSGPSAVGNTDLMLRDIWRRLGLDADTPMTAAADSITAGWLEQTITQTAGGVIVTRIDPPYTAPPGYADTAYLENQE